MDLYILRHAIAEEHAPAKPDSQRHLTPEGARKMRRIAKGIEALDLKFDLILSSPYYRAKETAEILAEVLGMEDDVKFSDTLISEGNPKELIEELKSKHRKQKRVVLVGHEPYLSNLISLLLSGHTNISINLKKAGFCALTVNDLHYGKCAILEWLLTPSQMRSFKG